MLLLEIDHEAFQVEILLTKIDNMAKQINVQAPWSSPNAAKYDAQSLGDWIDSQGLTSTSKFLINVSVASIFSANAAEMSLLYALAYVAASGNATTPGTFERLIGTPDGAQMWKVDGGTELLATRLAAKLGHISLNSPVSKVEKLANSYQVTLRNGTTVQGTHVVVAMSPPLAVRIQYVPGLTAMRDQLCQHMPMGSIAKAIAIYPTPFWRNSNYTAQVVSDSGTVKTTFDNSPHNATYGALMGFIEADDIRKLDDASDVTIQNLVRQDYINYFGPQAANPQSWVIQRWDNEEFSRGGPVAVAPPGVLTLYGPALKQRIGNIHFAGTESSDYWIGYMDGAIRSGQRAAKEVIAG